MLYEGMVCLLSAAIPVGALLSFRYGYRAGRASERKEDQLPAMFPARKGKERSSEEEERLNQLLRNIDSYNGSGEGQEVIR